MKRIEKIQFIGMGALGIMFGDFLAGKMGAGAVAFVGDKRRTERFEKEGAYCNEKPCSFSMIETGKQEVADLLVFAVKGTALSEAVELAKDSVGEDTTIISLLNGISSEEVLSEAFGEEHIVYTVAQGMDATREGNHLIYSHMGELRIGVPKGEGVDLNETDLQEYINLLDSLNPQGMPSMRQDGLAKRYSEVELFNGALIAKARKHGIAVPTTEMVYQRVKGIEAGYEK